MKLIRLIIFIFFMLIVLLKLPAQTTIHPKIAFVGYHPFTETNRHLFENNIDYNKTFVIEPMVMVSIETMLRDDSFSWRIMPGFYTDAASKPAFFIHAGLKLRLFQSWRHSLHLAAGGALLGRQRWNTIPGYISESTHNPNGRFEYRFEPFGELEYTIFVAKKGDITLSALYGYQHKSFTFTIGYRYWLSTTLKHPSTCGNCPFQKSAKKYRK
ncbi:MAG TPA: hypothetical protein PLO05_10315 [Bacteroidales bacterium]|nr:hypothetical protein [Bacteroidales bacterium]HXK82541.1 hypothetical protein [Bacteroidales bacterium]